MQNNDAKNRWSSIKRYVSNNENEKQVMGDNGWKPNENYVGNIILSAFTCRVYKWSAAFALLC